MSQDNSARKRAEVRPLGGGPLRLSKQLFQHRYIARSRGSDGAQARAALASSSAKALRPV